MKEVEAVTHEKKSPRLCYWCLENLCLKKRMHHEEKSNGVIKGEQGNYAEYRSKLDKATHSMCKKSKGIENRMAPGAEVFQVKTDQIENGREIIQANVFLANSESDNTERKHNKL